MPLHTEKCRRANKRIVCGLWSWLLWWQGGAKDTERELEKERDIERKREWEREHRSDYFHLCLGVFYYSPTWHICTLCKFSTNMRHRLSETAIYHTSFLPPPTPPSPHPCLLSTVWRLMTNVACLLASHLFSYNRFNPLEWPFVNGQVCVRIDAEGVKKDETNLANARQGTIYRELHFLSKLRNCWPRFKN